MADGISNLSEFQIQRSVQISIEITAIDLEFNSIEILDTPLDSHFLRVSWIFMSNQLQRSCLHTRSIQLNRWWEDFSINFKLLFNASFWDSQVFRLHCFIYVYFHTTHNITSFFCLSLYAQNRNCPNNAWQKKEVRKKKCSQVLKQAYFFFQFVEKEILCE